MNECTKIINLIKKSINENLDKQSVNLIEAHIKGCPECEKKFKKISALKNLLQDQNLETVKVPPHFDAEFHLKLSDEKIRPKMFYFFNFNQFFLFPKLAGVFTLIVLVLGLFWFGDSIILKKDRIMISKSEVSFYSEIIIDLEYNASDAINDVNFHIDLDDAIEFISENIEIKTIKSHSFKGNLNKGNNKMPFVVRVKKPGKWKIKTRAEYMGVIHRHEIILTANDSKVEIVYYKLSDLKIPDV